MPQYVQLPNNALFPVAEGEDYSAAMRAAYAKYPEAFGGTPAAKAGPKEGLLADVMGSGANLLNIGRTGIAALTGDATQAAQAGVARQEELQKKYKSGFEPEKIVDKFNQGEYLGAAGEAIRQVPSAVAGLLPSVGQTFGSAAVGRLGGGALGALTPIPGGAAIGAQVGQYAVPFLVNAIQALGGQAQEKVQMQKEAGEKPDVSALELAPYAAGNAALNLIGTKIAMPSAFKSVIGKKIAEETTDAAAAAARKELIDEARKVAGRGTFETILRGTGGFALGELPTEILQDVVDRAAIGKPLADDDAFKSYRATALNMVLASPLGGGLGVQQRMGARSTVATEDRQIASKQAAEQAAAEQAAKNTPDYALQVADDYAAAEKAKADLLAQKRKINKDSPTATADRAFNTELTQQLQELAPELSRLGAEYNRLAPAIKQIREQRRVDAMSPEEYSLEQLDTDVTNAPTPRSREQRLAALNTPIEKEEVVTPEAVYAADRLTLAKEQVGITADVGDYVDYLMSTPRMAQAIVDNQTPLPGLARKEQNAVRGALKLQLQAIEKQRAAAGMAGTAASQGRVGTVEAEEQAAIEEQRRADEAEAARLNEQRAETEREIRITPEVEGIRRLGKVPEGTFSSANADAIFRSLYQKQADERQVGELLSTLPMSPISTTGQIYAGMGFETASRRDLLTRIAVAKAHSGVEDVDQLRQELAALDARPAENTEIATRLPSEGALPEAEKKTVAAETLADQQSQTLREYIRFLEDQKRGKVRGTLRLGRQERVAAAGDEFKETFASQHVKELDTRLEAFGLPPLTEVEAKVAKGRVMRNLNELGERWGNDVPAKAVPGQRAFAAPVQAVEVLQEQIRSGMFKTVNQAAERFNLSQKNKLAEKTKPVEGGARIATPDELTLRAESTAPRSDMRIATELATQLRNTLDQRTYATPELPAPKGKEGSNRADMAITFGAQERGMRADINNRLASLDPDTKDFVRLADEVLPEITDPALVTAIKEELQGIIEGRKPRQQIQQDLNDFVTGTAKAVESTTRPGVTQEELQRTSAEPQMSLPGVEAGADRIQRATPKNFQKMLDSKDVQGMRAAIEEMRVANLEAIQEAARNTPAALRAARTAKARVAYNAALAQEQKTALVVSKLKAVFTEERAGAREAVDVLQNRLVGLQQRLDEIIQVRSMLIKETADLALTIQAPRILGQEKALQKQLKETETALEFAKDLVVAVDKQTAASAALFDMLTKEGTTTTEVRRTRGTGDTYQASEKQTQRAEQDVKDTRKELNAAEKAERDAGVEVEKAKVRQTEFRDAAQRLREGLDLPGIRSTVDTTKMNQQIAKIRSEMGSFNALVEKETDPAKKAEYQQKHDAAAARLETVYADAPRIVTSIKEKAQVAFEDAFDAAQIAAYDREMAKSRIKGGEYGPALANRRQGTVDRPQTGGRVVQTGEKRATPASEMAGSALERLAQERAALRELEDRVTFLRANGKDKVKNRLTDAFKALQAKVEKQKAVVREVQDAQQATVAAVRDVNKEERAAKAKPGYRGGIELSRGVPAQGGQTVASLEKALDKAVGDKGIAGKRIKLFQSVSDLFADPAYMYDYEGADIPSDAKAFVNPKNGQAFMFADNIAKGEELGILLHEIGAHIGFRNLFNAAQYARLITAVKSWAKRNDNSIEARVAQRAIERVEAAETTAEQYDDELLAYTIEEAVKAGVNPDALQGGGPIRSWLKAVLDVLRTALSKFGINPKTLTAGDLVNMAYGAAQLELRGTWHGSDAVFTAFDSNFSGAGEGAYEVRFEGSTNLGKGPYTTSNKEYAEYYQHAVPFGKAANESGYGNKTYQDYRSLDEKYMTTGSKDLSLAMLQSKYESNLLNKYLSNVSSGGALDPVKNTEAQKYITTIQGYADNTLQGFEKALANKIKRGGSADSVKQAEASVAYAQRFVKAVAGLDASKINGLTQRPDKGNLYRTLDDIPRSRIYEVNSVLTYGERPAVDELFKKYARERDKKQVTEKGVYYGNSLFYNMRDTLGINKTTALLKAAGIDAIEQSNEDGAYVERAYIDQAPEILSINLEPIGPATGKGRAGAGSLLFSRKTSEFDAQQEPSTIDNMLGNLMGLAGRMQLVDKFAAVSAAFKAGMSKGVLTDVEAGNAEYLLRFGEHRSQLAGQALTNGPLSLVTTKTDGGIEHTYQSTKGANAMQMAEALNKGKFASDSEAEGMFTLYVAGERAKQVGWQKLNYTAPDAEKAKYQRLMDILNADKQKKDAITEAARIYQQYNNGMMDFLVQTGELTATKAAELKAITYVPYYRVNANGEVQLMIDKERPVRIGNIKDEPQLQQLVGDNKQIMPIFASMVQNTFMLTNLGLRNQSVKETAFMLRKVGIASRIAVGAGPAGPSTVRFKKNGADMHVVIDTDMYGIPAKYIVEGMEGIKTTIPAVVKLLGIPADILRKFVTRAPPYAIRQTIRDPLNAWLTTGTDAIPVLSSFKELGAMVAGRSETERTLMESGAVSSNVFTGDERDMSKVLREITSGKSGWSKLLAKADAFALQGDTATRATIYKDSIAKGMSHQQALLRSVESMNFSRRGLSPSIQMLSTMIPFFNAQIQGLDVLYRAFKGDMTHSEQLQIREKLFQRGMLLAIGTMAYAAAMQDDEAYKRAKPEERYGNWFVYVPGVSEPLRVPIPFELGYLFKSLPEAVYNLAAGDEKSSEVVKGMSKLLGQSNPFALPQAIKPLTEVVLGKSFFGGDIESEREKQTLAKDRYRENSTEVAKLLGSVTGAAGISPIKIDYLIRGYTGGLGIALVQLANPLLNTEATAVEKPSTKPSKLPFIGGLFQPVEGRGTLDSAYEKMQEIQQVKGSYNRLIEQGKRAEATAFVQQYATQLALVSTSGSVQKALGEMANQERAIRSSPTLNTAQKDAALERLDKMKVAYARQFLTLADRTTPR